MADNAAQYYCHECVFLSVSTRTIPNLAYTMATTHYLRTKERTGKPHKIVDGNGNAYVRITDLEALSAPERR